MPTVYILYSQSIDKYYVGYSIDVEVRLTEHNQHHFVKAFTRRATDWIVFTTIECKTVEQAIKVESHIKSMKSRVYIENLKRYPEMAEKLLKKYQ